MAQTRTFTFNSRPQAVSAARQALHGFDEKLELGVFYDASLCVSELVTNAIIHAGLEPQQELRLEVTLNNSTLRVSVTDPGRGFQPPQPTADDDSGWGLYIVDRLSRRWGVDRTGGTKVWFEMPVTQRAGRGAGAADAEGKPAAAEGDAGEAHGEQQVRRRSTGRRGLRPQTTL